VPQHRAAGAGEQGFNPCGVIRGRGQAGQRPVLVLSHDVFNERSGTVIAVELPTLQKRSSRKFSTALTRFSDSNRRCEQMRTRAEIPMTVVAASVSPPDGGHDDSGYVATPAAPVTSGFTHVSE
jgi:mRNA-degrading endonuclease toxin of MazEF toxin-antitoxin module